jgi:hypothetical protein
LAISIWSIGPLNGPGLCPLHLIILQLRLYHD